MKKLLSVLIFSLFAILPFVKVSAKEPVNVYLFYGDGCPHCENAMKFFSSIEEEYGDKFNLIKYETWNDRRNNKIMKAVAKSFGDNATGVPYIIIGDKTFSGYGENSNADLISAIEEVYESEERYDVSSVIESVGSNTGVYITLVVIVVCLAGLLVFTKINANK